MRDESNRARYSIFAAFSGQEADIQDIPALGENTFKLKLPSNNHGWLRSPRVTFSTEFPVSLFYVWAYAETASQCLIYPLSSIHKPILPER